MKTNNVTNALTVALFAWLLLTILILWNVWVKKATSEVGESLLLHSHVVSRAQWFRQQKSIQASFRRLKKKKSTSIQTNFIKERKIVLDHGKHAQRFRGAQTEEGREQLFSQRRTRRDENIPTISFRPDIVRDLESLKNLESLKKLESLKNDPRRTLVHLHISKSGGTSFDGIGDNLAKDSGRNYVGHRHFDWSYIDKLSNVTKVDVVMFLRHPVPRAESHFYFIKNQIWTRQLPMYNQTIEKYLHDPKSLLQCRDVWQDQQASIMWLTGNHIAKWAHGTGHISPEERDEMEKRGLDYVKMCHLAAKRLNQTLWFGILEDRERSMELLQHALKLDYRPELPTANTGGRKKQAQPLSEWSRKAFESLMPQDIWLYNYAKTLFEARWVEYKTGVFTAPELPPLPDLPCRSTRFELNCTSGPLAESGPLHFKHIF